jgi:hypothetical protein
MEPCDETDLAIWRLVKDEPCRWCKKPIQSASKQAKALNVEHEMQLEPSQQKVMDSKTGKDKKQPMEPERKMELKSDVEMEMEWELKSREWVQGANESRSQHFVDSPKQGTQEVYRT